MQDVGCRMWVGTYYIGYNYLGIGAPSMLEMAKKQKRRKAKAKLAHRFVIIVRLSPERVKNIYVHWGKLIHLNQKNFNKIN